VKDLVAGSFEIPSSSSRQVSSIRGGLSAPLQVGQRLLAGEALRTARGVASLELSDGSRISLGEGSQLRIADPLVQRIGTIFYASPGRLEVSMGDSVFRLESAEARLTTNSMGQGKLEVLSGLVVIDEHTEVGAHQQLAIGDDPAAVPTKLGMAALEQLTLWRVERFLPGLPSPTAAQRLQIRLGGGMAGLLSANWAALGADVRLRLGGEAWLGIGAGVTLRPGEVDENSALYWSIPVRLGFRWIRSVSDSPLYFGLGGDAQLLLFPGCAGEDSCALGVTPRPGALAAGLAGVRISPRLALDVELSGGFHGFALPGSSGGAPVLIPQIGLSAALVFRP
jgi:hypothetical protein